MTKTRWSPDWPKESGYFWFYGTIVPDRATKRLIIIQVSKDPGRSPVYSANGAFMWPGPNYNGVWARVIMPDLPPEDS